MFLSLIGLGFQTRSLCILFGLLAGRHPWSSWGLDNLSRGAIADGSIVEAPPNKIQFDARERAWLQSHKKVKVGTRQYIPLTFMDKSGSLAGSRYDIYGDSVVAGYF
jgi:hypothetical protein